MIEKIPSRRFNQDIAGAKRAADEGPVIITDRGNPANVLLTCEYYQQLNNGQRLILDMFVDRRSEADVHFEPQRDRSLPRPIDLD